MNYENIVIKIIIRSIKIIIIIIKNYTILKIIIINIMKLKKLHCTLINNKIIYLLSKINKNEYYEIITSHFN